MVDSTQPTAAEETERSVNTPMIDVRPIGGLTRFTCPLCPPGKTQRETLVNLQRHIRQQHRTNFEFSLTDESIAWSEQLAEDVAAAIESANDETPEGPGDEDLENGELGGPGEPGESGEGSDVAPESTGEPGSGDAIDPDPGTAEPESAGAPADGGALEGSTPAEPALPGQPIDGGIAGDSGPAPAGLGRVGLLSRPGNPTDETSGSGDAAQETGGSGNAADETAGAADTGGTSEGDGDSVIAPAPPATDAV